MTIEPSVLHEIVSEIWEGMLGLAVVDDAEAGSSGGGRQVYAAVQITGAWDGAVIIECRETAAEVFAAALLGLDDGESADDDEVRDVMGELANMAGGNLKAAVGGESQLSLPTVVVGEELDLAVPGAAVVSRESFTVGEVTFTLRVMARDAGTLAAAV